jgi:regulator of sigma D
MSEFLKFYFKKFLKIFWPIIFYTIPNIKENILKANSTYRVIPNDYLINVLNSIKPWIWRAIALFLIWFIHMMIMYKLWNKKEEPISTGLSYDYNYILEKISKLKPEILEEVNKLFQLGYKCLKDFNHNDIKTAIQAHFNAYRIIIEYLESPNSPKITQVSKFYPLLKKNFNQLKKYNDEIGNNSVSSIDEYTIRKLINDINDNLKAIFVYF